MAEEWDSGALAQAAIEALESWTVDDPLSPFVGEQVVSRSDVLRALVQPSPPPTDQPVAVLTSIVEALGLKMDTPNGLRDVFDRIEQLKTREQELLTMLVRSEFAAPPPPENVLSASMASGLLLTLKAECEAQKARADAAEAAVAALPPPQEPPAREPPLAFLTDRMRFYAEGCEGIKDRAVYLMGTDGLARDAAQDLDLAIDVIRDLQKQLRASALAAVPPPTQEPKP